MHLPDARVECHNTTAPIEGIGAGGGRSRIRTWVGVNRRIYSPLPLAARATCRGGAKAITAWRWPSGVVQGVEFGDGRRGPVTGTTSRIVIVAEGTVPARVALRT